MHFSNLNRIGGFCELQGDRGVALAAYGEALDLDALAIHAPSYILTTNIRRKLTKPQRLQLLADFMPIIIPPSSHDRTDLSGHVTDPFHPGRRAIMDATGAAGWEAQALKSIHDKAPELL